MIPTLAVTKFLSIFTIIGQTFIAIFILSLITKKFFKKEIKLTWIKKRALLFAFLLALAAMLGSLFFSEIAKYDPCTLCWIQRALMYPLVFVLGITLLKKSKNIFYYTAPLSILGALVATYHYSIQQSAFVASCSTEGASCAAIYMFEFGYITMPMMSLTVFALITILAWMSRNRN
ncbi:disulfide bond formation protein B [archaeon]|jgi:disulfide bond formation protein DsbB|nr:disulfide bond formation protein B [archaeon]